MRLLIKVAIDGVETRNNCVAQIRMRSVDSLVENCDPDCWRTAYKLPCLDSLSDPCGILKLQEGITIRRGRTSFEFFAGNRRSRIVAATTCIRIPRSSFKSGPSNVAADSDEIGLRIIDFCVFSDVVYDI